MLTEVFELSLTDEISSAVGWNGLAEGVAVGLALAPTAATTPKMFTNAEIDT